MVNGFLKSTVCTRQLLRADDCYIAHVCHLSYIPAYKLKNLEQFFTLRVGVDLYAGLKICHQPLPG